MWRIFFLFFCFFVFLGSCKQADFVDVMAVTTDSVSFTDSTALLYGTIIDLGEGVLSYGHCWSRFEMPDISDSHTEFSNPNAVGGFVSEVSDFDLSLYYTRAYVRDENRVFYGDNLYLGDTLEYVKIYQPNAFSIWTMGETAKIWIRNLRKEHYVIELYRGDEFIVVLDGDKLSAKKYEWSVPLDVVQSDDYRIVVTGQTTGFVAQSECFGIKPRQPEGIDMVFVQGGEFSMGSNSGKADEKPVHRVRLDNFEINSFEITNRQYAAFLNVYRSESVRDGAYAGNKMIDLKGKNGDESCRVYYQDSLYVVRDGFDDYPVIYVTWYGAVEFCRYYGGRLPTEAEWEFAAKGGRGSLGYLYSGGNDPIDVGWSDDNAFEHLHPVSQKIANELGLYDMSGNVWEWCFDWYNDTYYEFSPTSNPQGAESGTYKIRRGGCWDYSVESMRTSQRGSSFADQALSVVGFRLVRTRL